MKTIGASLALILLSGTLVAPMGILSAFGTDQTVPLSPTELNATSVSGTQVFLMWTPPINATQSGVSGYKIEIKSSCSGSFNFLTNTTSITFLSAGLTNGTCYQYRVSAINSVGISNPSNIATATTLSAPSVPTNLVASAVSSSQINLSWNTPNNNGGTPINGYKIERRNSCAGNFMVIANTGNASTTYSNIGLSANTCYQYRVSAHNAIGTSLASNNATAITKPISTQTNVPSAPTGLSITVLSNTSLKLIWHAPSDNGGAAISGYLIQRNGTTIVNNTFKNQTSYIDTNLLPIHQQTYRVAAWNSVGLSPFSNTASSTTLNTTSTIPPGTSGNQTGTLTSASNLGQLVSAFVHQRNVLLKQQRAEIIQVAQECSVKIKDATHADRKQIKADCKAQIKEIKQKYKDLQNQFKEQFKELRTNFQSQIKDENENNGEQGNNNINEQGNNNISVNEETKQFNKDLTKNNKGLGKNKKQHHNED